MSARSPSARKSLSLSEHNLNVNYDALSNITFPVTNAEVLDGQKRASQGVGFQIGKGDEMSPRRKARRSMQPRKSILKSFSSSSVLKINDENTTDFTSVSRNYAHTIAFSLPVGNEDDTHRQSLARRVSFAPNAHVRMFEKNLQKSPAKTIALPPNTFRITNPQNPGPRSSLPSVHSRRSSIQNIASVSTSQNVFVGEGDGGGEESMDMETDSEADSSDDGGVEMGRRVPDNNIYGDEDAEGEEEEQYDEEEEMDMDETQVVYGGILSRQSLGGQSEASEQASEVDEEKTMDFTIAIGGMLPNSPPVGASNNRSSIGYSLPQSPTSAGNRIRPGEPVEGEMDMSMDETIAMGIIIDDSITSGSSEGNTTHGRPDRTETFSFGDVRAMSQRNHQGENDDGMDMTLAVGGILGHSQPHSPYPRQSLSSSLTRPISGTPSFARPTVSSAQRSREGTPKEKRNVFAPSPSPFKSTTPRKSGMETAGEVAKRLSFGSTTSSGGRKRPAEDDISMSGSAKKRSSIHTSTAIPSLSASTNIFAPTPQTQSQSQPMSPRVTVEAVSSPVHSPRKSLGATPNKSRLGNGLLPSKSPAKSPALRRLLGENVEADEIDNAIQDVQQGGMEEWDTPPTIQLSDFLKMAQVDFIDEFKKPIKRRSSVAKGMLGQSIHGDREFGLHEYAEAQIQSVFLNMYTWAANKMKIDIKQGQEDLIETDSICSLDNPPVIREYLAASEEDRALFVSTFKAFKTNTQLKAKERWYDWKMSWMERVKPDVEGLLEGMKEDHARLSEMDEGLRTVMPELKDRLAVLEEELERERKVVREISECDQDELAGYKAAIAEQSTQINGFKAELDDSTTKLHVLQAKLNELNTQKSTYLNAINVAKSKCDQFTRSDVLRLNEEYESLQHLHLWKPVSIRSDGLRLTYDNEIALVFDCEENVPTLNSARVELLQKVGKGSGKNKQRSGVEVTRGLFEVFEMAVRGLEYRQPLPAFVQRVGQLWSAAQRLRSEIGIIKLHYPISTISTGSKAMLLAVTVLLKAVQSKVSLNFSITPDFLSTWSAGIANMEVDARVVYGTADPEVLVSTVRATIAGATVEGYVGGLLQGCVDAGLQYA